MIAAISIDDQTGAPVALHYTAKRSIVSVSGLIGIAPLRDSRRVRPQAHGGIDETRYQDGRIIALEGEIMSTVSKEDVYAEFRAVTAPLIAMLGDGSPALLKWTEGTSGLQLQRLVKVAGPIDPPIQDDAACLRYLMQFYAEDPNAYSQTLQTVVGATLSALAGGDTFADTFAATSGGDTFLVSAGGTASFTNAGNTETRPLINVYGGATNPAVVCGARRITLTGSISDGEYVEVDLAKRTLTRVNGGVRTSAMNMINAANTQWFALAPGTTILQMVADSFSGTAHIEIVGRSAYA